MTSKVDENGVPFVDQSVRFDSVEGVDDCLSRGLLIV